jgi:Na+/melibiose symporter-like transporter
LSTAATAPVGAPLPTSTLLAYGLFGMPLAMAALPLYVHLPKFYGDHLGVNLALLGGVLLALRLADGIIDPFLGVLSDRGGARKRWLALAAPLLALGMVALFLPIPREELPLVIWLAAALALIYFAFSLATINHQAWGAELSADPVERTRITAVREGLALVGVVIASALPSFLGGDDGGLGRFALLFAAFTLACATITLLGTPAAAPAVASRAAPPPVLELIGRPLADPLFRRLLVVYMLNGIAAGSGDAVLFFIADVLDAEARQGMFPCAVLHQRRRWHAVVGTALRKIRKIAHGSRPWWSRSPPSSGRRGCLPATRRLRRHLQCYRGLALGADLALPPSLLADVIGRCGRMEATGSYFGLWTLATKLNLALAAGIALPLLDALGYRPGGRDASALGALAIVYALVPCVLKLGAVAALVWFRKAQ